MTDRRVFGHYRVVGKRAYRSYEPGTEFEAALDPVPEARAIARGDIELLRRIQPGLQPGSYKFPSRWPPPGQEAPPESTEAPTGASLIEGGG